MLRMHPLHRILVSLTIAMLAFLVIRNFSLRPVLIITFLWDVFACSYIILCWIVFFKRTKEAIIRQANKDDGSRLFVLVSIIVTAFAGLFAVLLIMMSAGEGCYKDKLVALFIAVAGMILSWIMVHTLFTIHYAHLYYGDYEKKKNKQEDLSFPGNSEPDYLDFAYFSFVIGMTFQVSDVEIASTKMRRTALAHGLLAFALNTFVVALTINLIASLNK